MLGSVRCTTSFVRRPPFYQAMRGNKFKAEFLEKKRPANFQPLSVISLLSHTATHYPSKMGMINFTKDTPILHAHISVLAMKSTFQSF